MSVFSHWSRDDTWASQPRWDTTQSPTTGLSFLITAATSGLQSYSYASLGLSRLQVATAGLGAASVVQIGKMPNGKLVAVKVDRESSRPLAQKEPAHFERYLGRLDLEIRILTNKCVKQNKNILNILGFGMDERGGEPSCFLVEEYSNLGDLKAFLLSGSSISVHQQLEFGLDIAKALEALHSLKVCHGDVKLENALVFEREDKPGWLLKLSDFSHAIVAIEGDPEGPVTLGFGTPLLRAPELYNGNASREGCFNIAAALKADTFSFGLFLWEVIKLGVTYFEDSWLTDPTQGYSVHDLEAKEAFLSQLSPGAFWRLVVGFLKSRKDLDEVSLRAVGDVLNRTLQYEPSKRSQIGEIAKILRDSVQSVSTKLEPINVSCGVQPSNPDGQIFALTNHQSLFEILKSGLMAGEALDDLPSSFQHQVVSDLERLAGRPGNPSASHANAAMTVSECYIVGYGVNSDMKSVLHWLHQAALAGSTKAAAWYNRLCVTVGSSPLSLDNAATYEDCENRLSDTPVVDYLHARIQQLELARRREAHLIFEGLFLDETFTEQRMVELATFHHLQTDHLSPVHVAAWLGLDSVIKNSLTSPSQVNLVSKLGRTAIFYACLGGNLSTLRFLINAGGNVDHRDFFGIAPLHLCVFFPKCAVEDAVSLLVKHGADPNAVMNSTLEWEEHDITLLGTPMEWAVQCRHSQLIQSLLQTAAEIKGLNTAIELFFWEIVDLLLLQKACNNEELPQLSLSPIDKPYRHWIAHGKDHLQSLSWTLDVLEKHGLDIGRQFAALDNSTLLIATIHRSKTVDDFEIIRQLAKRGQNVKFANENGFTALGFAISMSKQKETWTETLQELLTYYDISELEQNYIYDGSYLHSAVVSDSVIGARELLRKGVNVNQLTYDHFEDTPLQLCVLCDGSPEMMTLLLENGASTERSDGASKLSPLESRVSGLQRTSKLLDLLLERRCSREFCLPALHLALTNALVISDTARRDILEVFRHMIAKPAVQSLVNDTKLGEITLLHRAAASLNLYLTKLLLEAGADVRISTNIEGEDLIPLQVALGNGKFYWEAYASKSQSTTEVHERSRRDAFDTTCLLLSEHTAHKNGAFEGITQLHLAAYMGIAEVVEGLTASPGIDIEAKGSWPGQAGLLTPAQLLAATLVPDACGYPFVKPSSDISEQVQSPSTAPKEYTLRQEETDGRSLPFQDLEDVKTEVRDNYGVNMTLTLSPRLIYNNASRVMRLLGHEFSLTV